LADRIAADVAGAVAEELVFHDGVEPIGVLTDLRVALARAGVLDVEQELKAEGVGLVRHQVGRVRKMLGRRRRTLLALARVLRRTEELTRLDAVRIARLAGTRILIRPKFSPTVSLQELRDCDRARHEVAGQVRRLGRAEGHEP
jgi:hypothetical protein